MTQEELEKQIDEYDSRIKREEKTTKAINLGARALTIAAISLGASTLIGMTSFAFICFSAGGFSYVFNNYLQKASKIKTKNWKERKSHYENIKENGVNRSDEAKEERKKKLKENRKKKKEKAKEIEKYHKYFFTGLSIAAALAAFSIVETGAFFFSALLLGGSHYVGKTLLDTMDSLEETKTDTEKILEEMKIIHEENHESDNSENKEKEHEENKEKGNLETKEKKKEETQFQPKEDKVVGNYYGKSADELLNSEIGKILLGGRDISEFSQKHKESFADKIMKEIEGIVNQMEQEPDDPKENSQGK